MWFTDKATVVEVTYTMDFLIMNGTGRSNFLTTRHDSGCLLDRTGFPYKLYLYLFCHINSAS